jgi:hypothetical protein
MELRLLDDRGPGAEALRRRPRLDHRVHAAEAKGYEPTTIGKNGGVSR